MQTLKTNLMVAAEATFEADPYPRHEKKWCNIWCNTEPEKGAGATQVQHQKQIKTTQNKTK